MVNRSFVFDKKGQIIISTALVLGTIMISTALLLASTSVMNVQILTEDFRNDVLEVSSNFRGATSMAMAEVSKELELRSRTVLYINYTTLYDYPEARDKGEIMMADWIKTIKTGYTGLDLRLNVTALDFECMWNSSQAYSKVAANLTLDARTHGFYGWEYTATSELHLEILELVEQDEEVTFTLSLHRENNLSVTDLTSSAVKIRYQPVNTTTYFFDKVDPETINVEYLGRGIYTVRFAEENIGTPPNIKVIIHDARGIIAAAIPLTGVVLPDTLDTVGPRTINVDVDPNPCSLDSPVLLTAIIDDLITGANKISSAEYFVDTTGPNGTGTPLAPSDGYFDTPYEDVEAQLNVSTWALGEHTIYIHGEDAEGNWGNFSTIPLQVESTQPAMHIASIDMSTQTRGWWWWRRIRCRAEVTVVDSSDNAVQGATVYGQWSGSVSGNVFGDTNSAGEIVFYSDWISWSDWRWGGRFTFTVNNIEKDGWIYDESANVETSDTLP